MSEELFKEAARFAALYWARYLPGVNLLPRVVAELGTESGSEAPFFGIEGKAASFLREHYSKPYKRPYQEYEEGEAPIVAAEQFSEFVEYLTEEIINGEHHNYALSNGAYVELNGYDREPHQVRNAFVRGGLSSIVIDKRGRIFPTLTSMHIHDRGHIHIRGFAPKDWQEIVALDGSPEVLDPKTIDFSGAVEYTAQMAPMIQVPVSQGEEYFAVDESCVDTGSGPEQRKVKKERVSRMGFVRASLSNFDGTPEEFNALDPKSILTKEGVKRFKWTSFIDAGSERASRRFSLGFLPGKAEYVEYMPDKFVIQTPILKALALDKDCAVGVNRRTVFAKRGDLLVYDPVTHEVRTLIVENGEIRPKDAIYKLLHKDAIYQLVQDGKTVEGSKLLPAEFVEVVRRTTQPDSLGGVLPTSPRPELTKLRL